MSGKRNLFDHITFTEPAPMPEPDPPSELLEGDLPYLEVPADGVTATRITFFTRTGKQWSYPYSYIGLIDMPHPSQITIHGTCGTMESTIIQGQHLSELARLLDLHRISHIRETTLGAPLPEKITVQMLKRITKPDAVHPEPYPST